MQGSAAHSSGSKLPRHNSLIISPVFIRLKLPCNQSPFQHNPLRKRLASTVRRQAPHAPSLRADEQCMALNGFGEPGS
jgi:hypothetical protein